ncbi:MAG: D-glucuronyl C5-epimerase family protein [Actinomycetaceae bacterium]|nr:D-glucuronyl C5-epimerase family protein [Actinomycetaceae bacterium]
MRSTKFAFFSVFLTACLASALITPKATFATDNEDYLTVEEQLRAQIVSSPEADADFFNLSAEEEALYAPQPASPKSTGEETPESQVPEPTESGEATEENLDTDSSKDASAQSQDEKQTDEETGETGLYDHKPAAEVKEITVSAPFYQGKDSYTLPGINGVQWIVNGKLTDPGTHLIKTAKQRKRLIISAWTADPKQFRLVGTTSWVLQPNTFSPVLSNLQDRYTWEARQQIGQGWSGKIYSAGNFDGKGGPDLFRISPQGQLILYTTLSFGRFSAPTKYGYGWNKMTKLAGGADFNGDDTPDLLAVDTSGRLYLYPGNGAGGFKAARTPFGYGWHAFNHLVLLPKTAQFGPRLVATHKSGQMFIYEGNGTGGFKGGRTPLGFGWNQMHSINPGVDWDHDGAQDLLVVNRQGKLFVYKGNSHGTWGTGTQVGQGWAVMGTILSIQDKNQNILLAVDRNYRLWHYKNKQAGHVPDSVNSKWGFNTSGFATRPDAAYPYSHQGGWVKTAWQVDSKNVPIIKVPGLMNGQRIYHPVAYSRFALDAVENYFANEPSALRNRELARAEAAAQALVDGAILDEDTLWFPYNFPYRAMGHAENTMRVPWFSSMSQGFALATFVRLSQATGDIKWRQYADMTFASYFADKHEPYWITMVDDSGDLWLEEYPGPPIPSKVLNGHLFSAESLQYYWLDTKNAYAEAMVDGAVTSVVNEFNNFRTPGKPSLYCASIFFWRIGKNPADYHRIVANQIRDFGNAMNQPSLVELAQILYRDR